jgi:hypothetical protein
MLGAAEKQAQHEQQAKHHVPVPVNGNLAMSLQLTEAQTNCIRIAWLCVITGSPESSRA